MSHLNRAAQSVRPRILVSIEPLEGRQLMSVVSPAAAQSSSHAAAHAARVAHRAEVRVEKAEARQTARLLHHKAHQDVTAKDVTPSLTYTLPTDGVMHTVVGKPSDSPAANAFTPTQVRTAYGVSSLAATNQGQGVTIGIVDVDVDPNITSDLATFSTTYGLPQMDGASGRPTFTINNAQNAPNSPSNGGSSDTSLETALDVEWVHAIAPYANIVLVYANSFSYSSLLSAVQTAANTQGVVAVSTSYGGAEFSGETSLDSYLTTTTGSNTRTAAVDFSTGDDGYASFPATSTNSLAIGGTSLYTASARGVYSFETAWGGVNGDGAGGGGTSGYYATPTFQSTNGVNFGHRTIPDVSAIADLITGVSVYNSYDQGVYGTSWLKVGGTSLACPVVSAMVAEAQQNRIAAGLPTLSSPQINAKMYGAYNSSAYSTDFHDVTIGNNNYVTSSSTTSYYSATAGYDRATGIGTPKAVQFVSLLST